MKILVLAAALLTLAVAGAVVLLAPSTSVARTESGPAAPPAIETAALPASAARRSAQPAAAALRDAGQLAEEDCLPALAAPEGNSWLLRTARQRRIDSRLKRHGDVLARVVAADLAGVADKPVPILRDDLTVEPDTHARVLTPSAAGRWRSDDEQRQLRDLLAAEGVDGLIALGDASLSAARWDDTTTTGHLIRQYAKGRHPGLPRVAGWLSIGRHELATAIEVGIPAKDFAMLLDAADVDPTGTWDDDINLATVAALHHRPAILELLTGRGIHPAAAMQWDHRTLLDEIAGQPKPAAAGRVDALADVVRQLVAAGDQPYRPSTLATLSNWLPDAPLPALHPDSAVLLPALADAAGAIAELDAEWASKIAAAKRIEARCEAQLADPELSLVALEGTALASKMRYRDALRERAFEASRLVWEPAHLPAGDKEARGGTAAGWKAAVEEMLWATSREGWHEAHAAADRLGGHAHVALLYFALGSDDAPLDVLLALARQGGWALPLEAAQRVKHDWYLHRHPYGGAILDLARSYRRDVATVARALEPLGLDLHHVDAQGRNAFNVIARRPDSNASWRLARLLASRSVSVKPSAHGLDPLDHVLVRLSLRPGTVSHKDTRLARLLVDHGAPIEESHLWLAREIAVADEDAYRRLVSAVPELER